jgi:hypothetical protein
MGKSGPVIYPSLSLRWGMARLCLRSLRPSASATLGRVSALVTIWLRQKATGFPSASINYASSASSEERSACTIDQKAGVFTGGAVAQKLPRLCAER